MAEEYFYNAQGDRLEVAEALRQYLKKTIGSEFGKLDAQYLKVSMSLKWCPAQELYLKIIGVNDKETKHSIAESVLDTYYRQALREMQSKE